MKTIKFRRPHFKISDDTFSHFTYWGVELPIGNSECKSAFASPTHSSGCTYKEDQQFIGLIDKSGREIFEGDIVKFALPLGGFWGDIKAIVTGRVKYEIQCASFHVTWNDGMLVRYTLLNATFSDGETWQCDSIEVVGNIYENPELV